MKNGEFLAREQFSLTIGPRILSSPAHLILFSVECVSSTNGDVDKHSRSDEV